MIVLLLHHPICLEKGINFHVSNGTLCASVTLARKAIQTCAIPTGLVVVFPEENQ